MIDLRSDAVSKPTEGMLKAMQNAHVGDDVFGDDPGIIELEKYASELFGKDAALFCPSGIMCNQVALHLHTSHLKKFVCNEFLHIYYHESGGPAYLGGAVPVLIEHRNGLISANTLRKTLRQSQDISLVCLENTVNKGGGCFYTHHELAELSAICNEYKIPLHLDGARIFNALAESNNLPSETGVLCDTISFCLSKGLGAPAGSLLLGPGNFIRKARAIRNKFGGGMRQAGYFAAAGLFALKQHIPRLKDDHIRARKIGSMLEKLNCVSSIMPVLTNIIIFELKKECNRDDFLKALSSKQILAVPFGPQIIRFVTHIGITDEMTEKVMLELKKEDIRIYSGLSS